MCAASSTGVQTLYNATLNTLCNSMDENILQYLLKWYPAPIVFEVIWKVRHLIVPVRNYLSSKTKYSVL